MKETLHLPPGCQGALWRHASWGGSRLPHQHAELELNLALDGVAEYIVDDRRYTLRRGSLIWLFPEQEHLLLHESRNHRMWIGIFAPELVRRVCTSETAAVLLSASPAGAWHRVLPEAAISRLETLFEDVQAAQSDDPDCCNAGLGYALLTTWRAYQGTERGAAEASLHPCVEQAALLLRDERETVSVGVLARRVGMSASRLCELFRAQTGMSMVAFRNRQRVERFLRLYGDGQRWSASQAALEAGFGSYPQFGRVFRQVTGHSPAQYRRRFPRKGELAD